MMFIIEIFGWIGLFVIMVVFLLIVGKMTAYGGFILFKLLGQIIKPIVNYLRHNVHLNAPVLKTSKKKKLKYYEDYSVFR